MYSWICVSLLVPYSLGNHAQLEGGSVVERLRSTLAYGWVEHCSDIASCGTTWSSMISILCYVISAMYLLMIAMFMLNAYR